MTYLPGKFGVSNIGNTSGSTGTVNRGIIFAGGNNVTLSQSTNGSSATISISAAVQSSPNISLYALGNTTQNSSTLRNASNLSFNGLGAATVGYSNGSIQISAPVQSVQTQSRFNMTIGGNVLGVGALISSGALTLVGGNNITLSQNGNSVVISGSPGGNTFGMSNLGNTSGTTGMVSGSQMQMVLAGGNNITLSQSINGVFGTMTISGAAQSNQIIGGYASGNTTGQSSSSGIDARSLSFNGAGNVSVGYSAGSVIISGSGGGGGGLAMANSQTTYTSGTANLNVVGGAMTIASTTGQSFNFSVPQVSSLSATGALSISNNGNTVSIGAPAFSAGMSTGGNTSGTTGTASNQLIFAGGNNITLSQSTGVGGNTISIVGGAGGGGGLALANSQTTYTSGTAHMSVVGGAMTIASTTGQSYNFSVPQVSSLAMAGIVTASSNGATISIGAPAFSAGMSTGGNTSGTTGTASNQLIFAGGNNITLSQASNSAGNTLTIIGGAGGGGGGVAIAAGGATYTSGTANFVASGALTIASTTGQSFNLSVPQTSSLAVTGGLSASSNGNTISLGFPAPNSTMEFYQNMDRGTFSTLAVPYGSLMLQRLNQENDLFAANLTANSMFINLTANMTATSLSSAHTVSVSIGIYADNATNLSLINSASTSWGVGASTGNTSNYHGPRWLSFISSQWSSAPAFSQGGEYVFGIVARSSSYAPPLSFYGQNYMVSNQRSGYIGTSMAANTTLAQGNYWNGVMATTGLPTGITASQVNRNNASAIFIPHIILNNRYSGTF